MEGYIQVYTGNGKGKTTASLGLALRAAGAGLKVFVGQFIKAGDYSEIKALARFSDLVTVKQYGKGRFIKGKPAPEDVTAAARGLKELQEIVSGGQWDVVILEEGNVAVTVGLLTEEDLLDLMDRKPSHVELVITGRGALPAVIDKADLVTEMKEIKHYFQKGVVARVGIEK